MVCVGHQLSKIDDKVLEKNAFVYRGALQIKVRATGTGKRI